MHLLFNVVNERATTGEGKLEAAGCTAVAVVASQHQQTATAAVAA